MHFWEVIFDSSEIETYLPLTSVYVPVIQEERLYDNTMCCKVSVLLDTNVVQRKLRQLF